MIQLALTLAAGLAGYLFARGFVHQRLRFVDAVQSPLASAFTCAWSRLSAITWPVIPLTTSRVADTAAPLVGGAPVGALTRTETPEPWLPSSVFQPAQAALLPSLVTTPEELTAANAVQNSVSSIGMFVGPAIAGATVEVLKNGTALTDTNPNNVVRTGTTDGSGNYVLAFIPPGTYVVRGTPPSGSAYKPALLTGGATITAGATTSGKIIILNK